MSSNQMLKLSEISEKFSIWRDPSNVHEQNLVLPHVKNNQMFELFLELKKIGLTTANIDLLSDTIWLSWYGLLCVGNCKVYSHFSKN